MTDVDLMNLAIDYAKKGIGGTHPNPVVGAILERGGKVIGTGFHERAGDLHAERRALEDCLARGEDPRGANLFVTLEPCSHYGRQPPCCDAIINAGIKKVVIASRDPNPLVNGRGVEKIRSAGITVIEDFLRPSADALNEIFFHYIKNKKPLVAWKCASTIDGKIATTTGQSKWITGDPARKESHKLRRQYCAIMAGVGTILMDNPMLNCRLSDYGATWAQPVRLILDTHLRTQESSLIATTAKNQKTIIFYCDDKMDDEKNIKNIKNIEAKKSALSSLGVELISTPPDATGKVDIRRVFQEIEDRGFDSVLIEGGGAVAASALKADLVDIIYQFIGGLIFGDDGKSCIGGLGVLNLADSRKFLIDSAKVIERDVFLKWVKSGV